MACSEGYIDFVCSQLGDAGTVVVRKMFGDWCIYVDGKPVVLACDDICYVKMHPAIRDFMAEALTGYPYDGAKEHYILDVEHKNEAVSVVKALLPVISYPKK